MKEKYTSLKLTSPKACKLDWIELRDPSSFRDRVVQFNHYESRSLGNLSVAFGSLVFAHYRGVYPDSWRHSSMIDFASREVESDHEALWVEVLDIPDRQPIRDVPIANIASEAMTFHTEEARKAEKGSRGNGSSGKSDGTKYKREEDLHSDRCTTEKNHLKTGW